MALINDLPLREIRLTDLLSHPHTRELTRALVTLANLEDPPNAIIASVWATSVLMHRLLLDLWPKDEAAAKANQLLFAEMLAEAGRGIADCDLQRMQALLAMPVMAGPRRAQ